MDSAIALEGLGTKMVLKISKVGLPSVKNAVNVDITACVTSTWILHGLALDAVKRV